MSQPDVPAFWRPKITVFLGGRGEMWQHVVCSNGIHVSEEPSAYTCSVGFEGSRFPETLIFSYQITRRQIPENCIFLFTAMSSSSIEYLRPVSPHFLNTNFRLPITSNGITFTYTLNSKHPNKKKVFCKSHNGTVCLPIWEPGNDSD
jgi:hypothetical protein